MIDLILLAAVVLAFGTVSRRLAGTPVTAPMAFVAAGLAMGEKGLGWLDLDIDDGTILLIAELTLVLVLFTDASRIDPRALRRQAALPGRLLGIGMPLTIGAGVLTGLWLLTDLDPAEAAIVAVVLAPTDAALGQAVVSSRAVPARVRQALNVESGLNDGLSVPFLAVLIAVAAADQQAGGAGEWVRFAAEQIGYGALIGVGVGLAGGLVVEHATRARWMDGTFQQLSVLAVAVAAWGVAGELEGNGFIAAFAAGVAAGAVTRHLDRPVLDFTEDEGQLLNLATFFIFGAAIAGPALEHLTWQIALYALLSLTLVRMLPVALALAGAGLRARTVLFVGWFGPRGIASIVLSLVVLEETAIAGAEQIATVVSLTVLASVALHGLSAAPLSAAYGRWSAGIEERAAEMMPAPEIPGRLPMIEEREGGAP